MGGSDVNIIGSRSWLPCVTTSMRHDFRASLLITAHWTTIKKIQQQIFFLFSSSQNKNLVINREARPIHSFVLFKAEVHNYNLRTRKMQKSRVSARPEGPYPDQPASNLTAFLMNLHPIRGEGQYSQSYIATETRLNSCNVSQRLQKRLERFILYTTSP